jgi:hypothetical protein
VTIPSRAVPLGPSGWLVAWLKRNSHYHLTVEVPYDPFMISSFTSWDALRCSRAPAAASLAQTDCRFAERGERSRVVGQVPVLVIARAVLGNVEPDQPQEVVPLDPGE